MPSPTLAESEPKSSEQALQYLRLDVFDAPSCMGSPSFREMERRVSQHCAALVAINDVAGLEKLSSHASSRGKSVNARPYSDPDDRYESFANDYGEDLKGYYNCVVRIVEGAVAAVRKGGTNVGKWTRAELEAFGAEAENKRKAEEAKRQEKAVAWAKKAAEVEYRKQIYQAMINEACCYKGAAGDKCFYDDDAAAIAGLTRVLDGPVVYPPEDQNRAVGVVTPTTFREELQHLMTLHGDSSRAGIIGATAGVVARHADDPAQALRESMTTNLWVDFGAQILKRLLRARNAAVARPESRLPKARDGLFNFLVCEEKALTPMNSCLADLFWLVGDELERDIRSASVVATGGESRNSSNAMVPWEKINWGKKDLRAELLQREATSHKIILLEALAYRLTENRSSELMQTGDADRQNMVLLWACYKGKALLVDALMEAYEARFQEPPRPDDETDGVTIEDLPSQKFTENLRNSGGQHALHMAARVFDAEGRRGLTAIVRRLARYIDPDSKSTEEGKTVWDYLGLCQRPQMVTEVRLVIEEVRSRR